MTPRRPAAEVIQDHADRLMKIEGVVGVYEGRQENGETSIVVMVEADRPGLDRELTPELEGYPVRIEVGGVIRPLR